MAVSATPASRAKLPRTIGWNGEAIVLVDQTLLPQELRLIAVATVDDLVDAIKRLVVRGAPALGVAGALGVALAARIPGAGDREVRAAVERVRSARPTAVNLAWGVDRAAARLPEGPEAVLAEALAIAEEDVAACHAIGERGADELAQLADRPLRLLTHCNAGALACVEWGTALGVVRSLHARGLVSEVLADETRPLLQGSRLTAFELSTEGIAHRVVVDGAGPGIIARGHVDAVVVGADRVAANGDVVNKVGTYSLALAADRAGIPLLVAAPESTIDTATRSGDDVEIELRDADEVRRVAGTSVTPAGTDALNPAFDVTPAALVTALVTERRCLRPAVGETPALG